MKIIRQFFLYLIIPITIISYILDYFYNDNTVIFNNLFNIFLTSSIGFYTNFIAIKLLFKPKNKTSILKLQGLIPKNQEIIANNLGKQIQEQFLNKTDLAIYALEIKLMKKLLM